MTKNTEKLFEIETPSFKNGECDNHEMCQKRNQPEIAAAISLFLVAIFLFFYVIYNYIKKFEVIEDI